MSNIQLNVRKNKPAANSRNADFTPADYFLNIGFMDVDEDGNDIFISLPKGVALSDDDIKPITGSTPQYRNMVQSKNGFLQKFLDVAKTMDPGEERIVATATNGICLQIRRVRDNEDPIAADNPFMNKLAGISLG